MNSLKMMLDLYVDWRTALKRSGQQSGEATASCNSPSSREIVFAEGCTGSRSSL